MNNQLKIELSGIVRRFMIITVFLILVIIYLINFINDTKVGKGLLDKKVPCT